MIVKNALDKSLILAVPTSTTKDHNRQDLVNLMETYSVLEKAKDAFLNQEITFEEYITLCEKAQVNIDSYLETIEHNLIQFNLL